MTPSTTIEELDREGDVPAVPLHPGGTPRGRVVAHALAADVARLHSDALLRTARRYSGCGEDAHDAYQRALELLLQHSDTIDRSKVVSWMHVVIRREASALRRQRDRVVVIEDDDLEDALRRLAPQPEEQVQAIDLAQRAGEALATLKESEAQALCLRAQGMSYDEIAEAYGWSYTKVNRAVTEGRKAFVQHYRAVESGAVCGVTADLVAEFAADELSPRLALKVRAHLIRCSGCRALLHAQRRADTALQALLPPVFVIAASGRAPGGSWWHEHLLGPLGHAAGRLQPAADHLIGSKLGLAAASTLALAGSGLAVEQQVTRDAPPPKILRPGLTASAPSGLQPSAASAEPPSPLVRVVDGAVEEGEAVQARVRQRAAAASRRSRAATRRRAARERRLANEREFVPGTSEFASATRASAGRATATRAASAGTASAAPRPGSAEAVTAPVTEVPVGGESAPSVDVVTEASSSSPPSSGSVSDEFGD